MSDFLYFDHAATTSVRPQVWEALEPLKVQSLGNASSVHATGRRSRGIIDEARIALAKAMLVDPEEIIFTSGATEGLHLAIIGAYLAKADKRGVIYTSPLVHDCVWAALNYLAAHHNVAIKHLPLTKAGIIDLNAVGDNLIAEADLIVTEHLNSEIGILHPIAKLGKKIIKLSTEAKTSKPIFIVDAAASIVSERVGLDFQKCDLLAFSGEKFGGLAGSGVLLKHKHLNFTPLVGGSHEWGWRGGSENILGIAALKAAYLPHLEQQEDHNQAFEKYYTQIGTFLSSAYPNIKITTPATHRGGHIIHFILPRREAALFVAQADLAGLALSAGTACSSGSIEGSQTLQYLGYSQDEAKHGVRISWGWDTTQAQMDELIERLKTLL